MNCRDCGMQMEVLRSQRDPVSGVVQRLRECACGARGWTVETMVKWIPVRISSADVRAGVNLTERDQISDSEKNILNSESSKPEETRARVGRPSTKGYPHEFELIWAGCIGSRSKGNKYPAYEQWLKHKPSADLTINAWNLWMTTTDWASGFSPDLRKWLRARGWEDKPGPEHFKPRNGAGRPVRATAPLNTDLDLRP